MLNAPIVLYLGSRGLSAAGNLLAVAIFTRLAGRADYGQYLLIFAWSLIVYGFTTHWMRFAYFGVFQSRRGDEYVASLGVLIGAALAVVAFGFAVMALFGFLDPVFALAVLALLCGMTICEAASEVAKTRLDARSVALTMILRTCLTVVLGSSVLWLGGRAPGLAFAIGAAHLIAAVPCLKTLIGIRLSQSSRAAALKMIVYGWPLLLSFGVMAVGQSIDRLLLAHFSGAPTLGSYGAVADLLRQSFAVVGEAITLALIPIAKQHANDGDVAACNAALRTAFNACLSAAVFGAAFFMVFGDVLVHALLGSEFHADARDLILILATAFAFMTMRSYYFAQVIYFTHASHLELVISILFVLVSGILAVLLVPAYGATGAAAGLMVGHAVSCIAFMVAGRRYYRLPVDVAALGEIPLLAGLFVLASQAMDSVVANGGIRLASQAVLFLTLSALVVHRFGLLRSGPRAAIARPGGDTEAVTVASGVTSASM